MQFLEEYPGAKPPPTPPLPKKPKKNIKTNMDDSVSMTHQYIVPFLIKITAMYNITKAF